MTSSLAKEFSAMSTAHPQSPLLRPTIGNAEEYVEVRGVHPEIAPDRNDRLGIELICLANEV
jgi:hypothetical protein